MVGKAHPGTHGTDEFRNGQGLRHARAAIAPARPAQPTKSPGLPPAGGMHAGILGTRVPPRSARGGDRSIGEQYRPDGHQNRPLGERHRPIGEPKRTLGESNRPLGERRRPLGESNRAVGKRNRSIGERHRSIGERRRPIGRPNRSSGNANGSQLQKNTRFYQTIKHLLLPWHSSERPDRVRSASLRYPFFAPIARLGGILTRGGRP
jgi:hypothetical protein